MPRVPMPTPETMTPAQLRVYEEAVAGLRGHAPAPLIAWLNSPELASRAQKFGEFARYQTSLPRRLSELAILMTGRFWNAQYEWSVHKPEALKAGLSAGVVEDIAKHRTPQFENADEKAVYEFVQNLLERHVVTDDVYQAAMAALGSRGVVELVGILGYYALISMTICAFEIENPPGMAPELA